MSLLRPLRETDGALYRLMHRRLRSDELDPVMVGATNIGGKSAAWLALAAVLFVFGDAKARRTALVTVAATLTAQGVVNLLLKPVFRRKRPYMKARLRPNLLVRPPKAHSWPSGHSASSAAAVATLAATYPERTLPLLALGAVISYSRVYVGVHYPFDVAAGTVVGAGVGVGYVVATRKFIQPR